MTTDEGKELATKLKCAFTEASAKTNTNVETIFMELVKEVNKLGKKGSSKDKKDSKKKKCNIL